MLVFLSFPVFVITISGIQCVEHSTDIVARLKALEDKVERQNDVISLQATQIKDLQKTVLAQKQSISDLTEKIASQDNDKKKMRNEVNDLKARARGLERTFKHRLEKVQRAPVGHHVDKTEGGGEEDKATDIQRFIGVGNTKKRFVLDTVETVAFEATMTGLTQLPHSHINNRVIFETVSLNIGSSYHAGNGTFVAPISGIFIFSTSVMMTTPSNKNDPGMHVVIEKNDVEVAGAYAYSRGSFEHSSVTAAVSLQAGDAVFVSVERHDDISFWGDRLTSFMGFLLYPF